MQRYGISNRRSSLDGLSSTNWNTGFLLHAAQVYDNTRFYGLINKWDRSLKGLWDSKPATLTPREYAEVMEADRILRKYMYTVPVILGLVQLLATLLDTHKPIVARL